MDELLTSKNGATNEQGSFKNNLVEFEKAFRELKSELFMKRNEVTQLKLELEEANHENNQLKESLDKLKKTSEENKITMEMFMQRTREFEPKYYEKRDALVKLELQYKMETSKNNSLREDLQKMAKEKSQLMRKVDVLEEQRKRDLIYSNDINRKLGQLKSTISIIKGDIQKAKEDQQCVVALSQQIDLAQESANKIQQLSNVVNKLKREKDILEGECVKYKAKCDILESFISTNKCIVKEDNLEARVLLTQCKKMSTHYKQQIQNKNEVLSSMNECLCQAKETNTKLIEQTIGLETTVKELESKLELYEKQGEEAQIIGTNSNDIALNNKNNTPIKIEDSQ